MPTLSINHDVWCMGRKYQNFLCISFFHLIFLRLYFSLFSEINTAVTYIISKCKNIQTLGMVNAHIMFLLL